MKRVLLGAVLALVASPAFAQPAPLLLGSDATNDSTKAYDLVFVSEGYQAAEREKFLADARRASHVVATDPVAAPLRAMKPFNFHYVFVPSNAAGAPFTPGAPPADTAFKATIEASGWITANDAAADVAAATAAPDVDGVVVLIKFQEGAGWQRSNADVIPAHSGRVRLSRDASDALIHELGHTIGGLGDEYTEIDGAPTGDERTSIALYPNLSLDATGARWKDVTPTVVEGGGRYTKGVYRSAEHCRMNESTSEDFCAVCKATMAKPRRIPPPASSVVVNNGTASWIEDGNEAPTAWWVQVERRDGWASFTMVRKQYVEPQTPTLFVGDLPPGDYRISVWSESMAGGSPDAASASFTIEASSPPPDPPSATTGITASLTPGS